MKKFLPLIFLLQTSAWANEPMWVNLFPPDARKYIDQYEMDISHCDPIIEEKKKSDCRSKVKFKGGEWSFNLFEKPNETSKKIGILHIKLTPTDDDSKYFMVLYKDQKNPNGTPLNPTDVDPAGGARSYLDFTIIDTAKEDWIQFPKYPFPSAAWMRLPQSFLGKKTFRKLELGRAYRLQNGEEIIFTKIYKNSATYRKFNKNDMLCGDEPIEIPEKDLIERTMKFKDLYDKDGHLNIKIAYTRGC